MSKNSLPNGSFIACVPHQIEADWDEKWGPPLAGFPINIMYACVQRAESDQSKMLGITACYARPRYFPRDQEDSRDDVPKLGRWHLQRAGSPKQSERSAGNLQI